MASKLPRLRARDRSRARRKDRRQDNARAKVMPFGEHNGKPMSKLPIDYIRWGVSNLLDVAALEMLTDELIRRNTTRS